MSEVIETNASQQEKHYSEEKPQNRNRNGRRNNNNRNRRRRESEDSYSHRRGGEDEKDDLSSNSRRDQSSSNSRKRDSNRRDSNRDNTRGNNRNRRISGTEAPPIVDDGASYKAKMNRNYQNSIFIGNLPYNCTGEDLTDGFNKFGQVIRSDIVTQKGRHRGMGTVEFRDFAAVLKAIRKMNNEMFMGRIIFVRKDNPPPEDAFNNNSNNSNNNSSNFSSNSNNNSSNISNNSSNNNSSNISHDDEHNNRRNRDESRRDRSSRKTSTGNRNKNSKYDEVGEHSMSTVGYEIFAANLPFSTKAQDLYVMFSKFGKVIYAKVIRDRDGRSRGYGVCNMETKEQAMSVLQFCHNLDIEGRKLDCKVGKIGWSAPSSLVPELDSKNTSNTEEMHTITESELTERELIRQREAERSMRDQGTFSFMDDIINGGTGITKIQTNTISEKEQSSSSEQKLETEIKKENDIISEEKKPLLESNFILLHNVSTDADHNDIVELCQSFGTIKTSSREHIKPINPLYDNNKEVLGNSESVIVEFTDPVTDESCVKVLNGFTYAGKELDVQLYDAKK